MAIKATQSIKKTMRISVFGLGYVGCVSAAAYASMGHKVIGIDVKNEKILAINSGKSPIFEKGLDTLLSESVKLGNLKATDSVDFAVHNSDISLVCVGTPSLVDGGIDLTYIKSVCREIAYSLENKSTYHVIAIRSTIPPGTIEQQLIPLLESESGKNVGKDFGISIDPEFWPEGQALEYFFEPERIIIGAYDDKSFEVASKVYKNTIGRKINSPIFRVPIRMAEICKYLDNTFHALKVVFANEVGAIAKNMDIDSQRLMEVFCEDKKMNISSYYLRPGFSFGGSCLPKDVKGMNHIAKNLGLETPIISSIIASNDSHTNRALELVKSSGFKNLGFVGIAFKEDTDDIRGNPIISVINSLCENKKNIIWLYDSLAKIDNIFDGSNVFVTNQIDELIEKSEVIILSNRTAEYRAKVLSSKKPIIDLNKSVYKECESICLV